MTKNYGRGQVYDLTRPLSGSWTTRPREYRDVPALHVLSFFAEANLKQHVGGSLAELQAGLRTIQMPHLGKRYHMHGRVYLDPRVNLLWRLPEWQAGGKDFSIYLGTGYGMTTRMPTADYLYPQCSYADFLQLNYFDAANPDRSLVSLMTYINDATNYALRPARNRKLELRAGLDWGPFSVQVSYFREKMTAGFRYSAIYAPYTYKKYDQSAIPAEGIPDLAAIPYETHTVLSGFRRAANGSRIDKHGVEFTVNTTRWQPLRTSLTITGAWFRSTYSNSQDLSLIHISEPTRP